MVLTGLKILIIGSSHLAAPGNLITTLHDNLLNGGAVQVHTIGVCGSTPSMWVQATRGTCGSAERINNGPIKVAFNTAAVTTPIDALINKEHPDLLIIVMGDTLAGYTQPELPQAWATNQINQLMTVVRKSSTRCVWVGPTWGGEGTSHKDNSRVQQVSSFLSTHVKPCSYINSLNMAKPGEWKTFDGQHLTEKGYKFWADAILKEI